METNLENKCSVCDGISPDKSRRYYAQERDYVIVESPTAYTPVLVSRHGKYTPSISWFQHIKAIASKLYSEDFVLQARRSGEHFIVEVTAVFRTRDVLYKP